MRSPLARASVAALLSILTGLASAQVRVEVPTEGAWEAWIGQGEPGRSGNFQAEKRVISVPSIGSQEKDLLWIYDPASGNVGAKPLGDLDGTWKVVPAELNRAAKVLVTVSYNGDPVAAANVILKSSGGSQKRLLTPSSQGLVTFTGIPTGSVEVAIETSKDGNPVTVPVQKFLLPLKRDEPVPTLRVAIGEPVDVVATTTTSPTTQREAQPKATSSEEPRSNNLVAILFSLLTIGGLAFLVWKYLPKYQTQIDAQLQKVGVQIPTDPDAQADDPPATAPVAPTRAPVQPIVLGPDATPDPIAAVPAGVTQVPSGVAKRWVNTESGEAVILPDGVTLVTREPGSALSIPGATAVSRRHAEVTVTQGTVKVKDLASTNGSFLNSVKLMDEVEVSVGDTVQFGDTRFRLEAG